MWCDLTNSSNIFSLLQGPFQKSVYIWFPSCSLLVFCVNGKLRTVDQLHTRRLRSLLYYLQCLNVLDPGLVPWKIQTRRACSSPSLNLKFCGSAGSTKCSSGSIKLTTKYLIKSNIMCDPHLRQYKWLKNDVFLVVASFIGLKLDLQTYTNRRVSMS